MSASDGVHGSAKVDVIDSGAYQSILTTWGVQQGAVKTAQIDPTS